MKANYTYDREQNAMSCGPGKYYTKQSFILGKILGVDYCLSGLLIILQINFHSNSVEFTAIRIAVSYISSLHNLIYICQRIYNCVPNACSMFCCEIY